MLKSPNLKNIKLLKKVKNLRIVSVLLGLIRKNLKLILRSKSSALIVLLGPLFIALLVGAAFNTSGLYDIKIATYSSDYSELTNALLGELSDKQFSIIRMDSEESCINNLKIGQTHVCAVFPPGLKIGSEESVIFYVDHSRMNLVWVIIETITSKVSTKSSELSLQLTTIVLDALTDTSQKLTDKEAVMGSLSSTNQDAVSKANTVTNTIRNLDLSFPADYLGVSKISQKLEDVLKANNYSASTFKEVTDAIKTAKNKTNALQNQLSEATIQRDDVVVDLGLISDTFTDNINNLKAVDSTFKTIKEKISNIEVTDPETIISPIKTSITPVVAKKTHLNYMFPTLAVLIIMFICLLLSSTLVIREKTSPAFFRNFITPVPDWLFLVGDFLTNLIILLIQLVIIFTVAALFFKGAFISVLTGTILAVLFISTLFILIGMTIGYLFKSEETATLGAVSIGSILLFFSSTVLPIETLPKYIKEIAQLNPFVVGESMLRKVMLFGGSFNAVLDQIGILSAFIIVFSVLVYFTQKLSKKLLR